MRTRTITTLAVLAVALLAACGSASSLKGEKVTVEATPAAMRQVADKTIAQGSSHVAFTMAMTLDGRSVTIPGSGDFDPARRLARMTMDMRSIADQVGGDAAGFASMFAKPMVMILSGTTMYMDFPPLAALGGGKEWVKVDIAAKNPGVADALGAGTNTDPSNFLAFLRGAGQVTAVGTEDIDGVSTTHFSGSYTLKQALDAAPADKRAALESVLANVPPDVQSREIPYDVWVDGDGLIHRMKMGFDLSGIKNAADATATMTMDFSDFGKTVDITVPSDDQVADLGDLMSSFGSASSSAN